MIASMGYGTNTVIEKRVSKNRKAFTVRLNMSVNSKAPNVIKKLTKEFLSAFRATHDSEKKSTGHESQSASDVKQLHDDRLFKVLRLAARSQRRP